MADKLTPLEEVKLDAEFNYKQRLEEQAAKARHEEQKQALKNGENKGK